MHPKVFFKQTILYIARVGFFVSYYALVIFTCALTAILVASPIVLLYLTVMQCIGKALTLFNGQFIFYWLISSTVIFVPLLIYSVIYRIRLSIKQKKAMQEALEKAKKEAEVRGK